MDFTNTTAFPAAISTGSTGDKEMLSMIACKVTYRLAEDGLVAVPAEQAWPVFEKPYLYEGVTLRPELDFRKSGIDLLIFGKAIAPQGEPTRRMQAAVTCGHLDYRVEVFGARTWEKSWGRIVASEPEPFLEMPLTKDWAFGGQATFEGHTLMYPANPQGVGFYMSEEEAAGRPLPNLERPEALIQSWMDRPRPACFIRPSSVDLDALDSAADPQEHLADLIPSMFNQAVSELVARPEMLGERLRLDGFSAAGALTFPVPPLQGPSALVSIGGTYSRFPSALSSLVVLAPARVLIVTYLVLFRYLFMPREKRSVELQWKEDVRVPLPNVSEVDHG